MILTVEMVQTWQGDSLYHLGEGRRHQKQWRRQSCLGGKARIVIDGGE
jgi:hypothetical protein